MAFTLITHSGANRVSETDLAALPAPIAMGTRHKPTSHFDLVSTFKNAVTEAGIEITGEQYALQDSGKLLFFGFDTNLVSKAGDRNYSIVGRNSTNERLAWRSVLGVSCFICDNLLISGEEVLLHKKNTLFLSLGQQVQNAVMRVLSQRSAEESETARRKQCLLSDERAKAVLFDAFASDAVPVRLLEQTARNLFSDSIYRNTFGTDGMHSLYSVQNGLTETAKLLKPEPKYRMLQTVDATFRRIH